MALDFTILGENDEVVQQVSLGADEHSKLIEDTKTANSLPLFSGLTDYYADATIPADQLDNFLDEIWYLESIHQDSKFLDELILLVEQAQQKHVPIQIIAD